LNQLRNEKEKRRREIEASKDSLDYDLAKLNLKLHEVFSEVENCQEKVQKAKNDILSATAAVARMKFGKTLFTDLQKKEQFKDQISDYKEFSWMKHHEALKALSDADTIQLLTTEMRHKCQNYKEIRDRKVELKQLKSKLKNLQQTQSTMTERRRYLLKYIEHLKIDQRFRPIAQRSLTEKLFEEEELRLSDLKSALIEVNPDLASFLTGCDFELEVS